MNYKNSERERAYDRKRKAELKAKDPEAYKVLCRDIFLKTQYGITIDDFNQMLIAQNYSCAICGTKDPGNQRPSLLVDHDHSTGKIRGLLCNRCNIGLGHFKDSRCLLLKAVGYLRKSEI